MAGRSFEDLLPTGARYVDGDERKEYTDRPLKFTAVHHEPKAQFGPRWVTDCAMLDTGELIALSFAANATRDTMFSNLAAGLEADGSDAWAPACLYMAERAGGHPFWTFRSATPEEIAQAAEELAARPDEDEGDGAGDGDAKPEPEPAPKGKGK